MTVVTPTVPDGEQAQAVTGKRYRRPVTGARLAQLRAQVAEANAERKAYWKQVRANEGKR